MCVCVAFIQQAIQCGELKYDGAWSLELYPSKKRSGAGQYNTIMYQFNYIEIRLNVV